MIISPPLLKTPQGSTPDEQWLADLMPFPNTGNFPVTSHLGWHGGLHIEHTDTGATGEAVRAIADGTIVYFREPTGDYDAPPLNYNGPTHNGCIVIKHETEIGEGDDGKVVFFSIYMHLKQTFKPVGTSKIYRKEPIGTVGQCGHDNTMHIEIVCDDANLKKLVGRSDPTLDVSKDGRDKVVYGDMHFYLPAGAQFHAAEPAAHIVAPTTAAAYTSTEALYVTMRLEKGQCSMTTRREDPASDGLYAIVGDTVNSPDYEYNLYKRATTLADACVAAHLPNAPAPSAMYELLRFGRVINIDNEQAIAPGAVPHWREVSYPGGKGWVDLNAAGVTKFSDGDFPHWMGWALIDDDPTPDSQCNSPTVMKWLDADRDGKNTAGELMMALRDDKVQTRLARTICKFPTEWEKEEIDTRYGWLKQQSDLLEEPLTESDYAEFKAHLEALCFWEKAKARMKIDANHWHFHPREFIGQFRKCGWLSKEDVVRVTRATVKDKRGREADARTPKTNDNIVDFLTQSTTKRPENLHVPLQKMMRKYGITTSNRIAYLFSQLAAETGRLEFMVEGGADSYFNKYEPGTDQGKKLGNTQPNDGKRFKGRGIIQITGRDNYTNYGRYRGNSNLYLTDATAASIVVDANLTCDASGYYWSSKQRYSLDRKKHLVPLGNLSINYWIDQGCSKEDAQQVTKCINPGLVHFEEVRWPCFVHAWYVMNDDVILPSDFKPIKK